MNTPMNTPVSSGEQTEQLNRRSLREENKTLKVELQNSKKREQLTQHILQYVDHSTDIDYILSVISQEIGLFFEADRCLVIYHQGNNIHQSVMAAQYCRSLDILPIEEKDVPWSQFASLVENTEKKIENPDKKAHPAFVFNFPYPEQFPSFMREYGKLYDIQSILSFEIRYQDLSLGRVALHQCTHPRVWLPWEVDFFQSLVPYIGSSLYQAELRQQEQQAKQAAEEANRKKTKLLAYVAHDFKTPLNSMARFIDIVENDKAGKLSLKQKEAIQYLSEGIQLLRGIVTDILDRARLEEGKISHSPQWLELSAFMEEIRFLFTTMASEKAIDLQIHIAPPLHKIYFDPMHLKQLLINLASNAVKYNHVNGHVIIRFSETEDTVSESESSSDTSENRMKALLIEVQDTGIGIPQEKIPDLFTDYYRIDFSQPPSIEGTGLGLSFVKKLVELYAGTIKVDSTVGVGSTFTLTLPILTA